MQNPKQGSANVEMARKCLGLIRDIAEWGALSPDPAAVGYALQELSQVLLERTGTEEIQFEPMPADEIHNPSALYLELQWVEGFTRDRGAGHRCH
jgi:hypothetical protein